MMDSCDGLFLIFKRQRELQQDSFGIAPHLLAEEERMEYIRSMTLGLIAELNEALQESGWKPWQSSNHLWEEAFGKELVDALHFLVNLFLVANWNADKVENAYFAKAEVNRQRQKDGYDGIAQKCTHCGRALDEPELS